MSQPRNPFPGTGGQPAVAGPSRPPAVPPGTAHPAAATGPQATAHAAAPAAPAGPPSQPSRAAARVTVTPPAPQDPAPPPATGDHTGPSGRADRLRVGWHTIPRPGLRAVTLTPPAGSGLILGRDQQRVPVPLRLFGPDLIRAALVGGVWAAQLLIFRAFATGARVLVVTTDQRAWSGFGERATGQHHRLTVLGGEPGALPPGSAQSPSLIVYDTGEPGASGTPPGRGWSTRLTLLRRLDRAGVATLQEAALALIQRLDGDEASLAATALRLDQEDGRLLRFLTDDMVALATGGSLRFVSPHPTAVEQQHLGPPRLG